MRDSLDLGGLSHGFVCYESSFRIYQVRRKDRVDERRLSQSSWPCITKLSEVFQILKGGN